MIADTSGWDIAISVGTIVTAVAAAYAAFQARAAARDARRDAAESRRERQAETLSDVYTALLLIRTATQTLAPDEIQYRELERAASRYAGPLHAVSLVLTAIEPTDLPGVYGDNRGDVLSVIDSALHEVRDKLKTLAHEGAEGQ